VIDLWELAEADDRQDIEGWRAPFDGVSATSPEVKLARRIQAEIKSLVASGIATGSKSDRRRLRYGDMLVLVRRRGNAFDAVIQALKHANIPVAGADRLKLTEHIAVIDLMSLADTLLLPQDDLALAVALKSPLFGLTDDEGRLAAQGIVAISAGRACRGRWPAEGCLVAARTMRAPLCQRNPVCVLCLAARRRRRPRADAAAART
jgi:ATP-dependent helicase/nuclease subunit A